MSQKYVDHIKCILQYQRVLSTYLGGPAISIPTQRAEEDYLANNKWVLSFV